LARIAGTRDRREADLIREAVRALADDAGPPHPRLPLFTSGKRRLATDVEKALAGFGTR
jgi:hypothetical protein